MPAMHTEITIAYGRRAHWRNHYQREIERTLDELRNAQARLRTSQLQDPNARQNAAQQMHLDGLRVSLNKFRANLARWSDPA
jgi:hypothetical protein